jgi:hypothetical protein
LFLQLNHVSGRRYDYWGRLPVLPGAASSFVVTSVPEASVSMSAALRGPKIFG